MSGEILNPIEARYETWSSADLQKRTEQAAGVRPVDSKQVSEIVQGAAVSVRDKEGNLVDVRPLYQAIAGEAARVPVGERQQAIQKGLERAKIFDPSQGQKAEIVGVGKSMQPVEIFTAQTHDAQNRPVARAKAA